MEGVTKKRSRNWMRKRMTRGRECNRSKEREGGRVGVGNS